MSKKFQAGFRHDLQKGMKAKKWRESFFPEQGRQMKKRQSKADDLSD